MSSPALPPTVEIATTALLDLLVEADVTDPARWPECARQGADWLRRIREIEAECIAAHGEFDWGKLDADTQDEYDGSRASLNRLLDNGKPTIAIEDFMRQHGIRPKQKAG